MLCDIFGEHPLSWTEVFEWHIHFKAVWVSVEDSGRLSTSKMTENVKKNWRNHPRRLSLNNSWDRRHCWHQLQSLPGDLNKKF
jgi:hypothetical protein